MTECTICGMPIENLKEFVIYDEETYCITCFQRITQFREDYK